MIRITMECIKFQEHCLINNQYSLKVTINSFMNQSISEPTEYITISRAISTLNFMTCVKFVPWDGKKEDYLIIWPIKFPKG